MSKTIIEEFREFLGICYGGILDDGELDEICSTLKSLVIMHNEAQKGNFELGNEILVKSGLRPLKKPQGIKGKNTGKLTLSTNLRPGGLSLTIEKLDGYSS